jgi:FAD/FMN-containing dehydrogenase
MPGQSIDQLKSAFRGELIQSGDPSYEAARKVFNGMINKRPRLIAQCVDVADVMAAVDHGRENGLLTAIRGGGHNGAGLGTCDGGLVIDLSRMKGIRVDPAAKKVRVEAGCVWGDVDHATHPFGLAVPCGFISTTGVAGLALGGGIGYLTRQYGLTIDNILSVDMVLADGSFVTANDTENPELFWAVRGGRRKLRRGNLFRIQTSPGEDGSVWPHLLAAGGGCHSTKGVLQTSSRSAPERRRAGSLPSLSSRQLADVSGASPPADRSAAWSGAARARRRGRKRR